MTIDDAAIARVVSRMSNDVVASLLGPRRFDADGVHFNDPDDPELTARYILCVDAINFCFWPDHEAIRDAKAQGQVGQVPGDGAVPGQAGRVRQRRGV